MLGPGPSWPVSRTLLSAHGPAFLDPAGDGTAQPPSHTREALVTLQTSWRPSVREQVGPLRRAR